MSDYDGTFDERRLLAALEAANAKIRTLDAEAERMHERLDCGQVGVCATAPGCLIHWEERNLELVVERDRLRAENMCDACAGTGDPGSGKPCMCGGSGRMSDAAAYLRECMIKAQADVDCLRTENNGFAAELATLRNDGDRLRSDLAELTAYHERYVAESQADEARLRAERDEAVGLLRESRLFVGIIPFDWRALFELKAKLNAFLARQPAEKQEGDGNG